LGSPGYGRHLAPLLDFISLHPVYRYFPDLGGGYDNPFYPLGLIYALLILASVGVLIWLFLRPASKPEGGGKSSPRGTAWHLLFFLLLTLASIFMMLSYSLPLWRLTQPVLASLQYPWRFMALTSLGLAFLSGGLFLPLEGLAPEERRRWSWLRNGLGLGLLLLLIAYGLADLPIEPLPLEDEQVTVVRMWEEDFAARQIGATWTAEYVPIWVEADRSVVALPPPDLVPFEPRDLSEEEMPQISLGEQGLLSAQMRVNSAQAFPLRFHAFYFPGWKAYLDGQEAAAYPSGELALLTVDVPPGEHRVLVSFENTTVRLIGNAVSLLTALGLVAFAIFRGGRKVVIALAIGAILLGSVVGWHIRPFAFSTTPQQKEVNLEDQVELLAYSLDKEAYRPGDTIHVTLYWLALQEMSQDYKVFVHFMDEGLTTMWAQHDGDPVEGFTPTTRWLAGQIVADQHALYIPPEAPPGRYKLFTGMYEFETMRNLTILTPEAASPNNRIFLQDVEVVPQ
jgi:hypothetical protein